MYKIVSFIFFNQFSVTLRKIKFLCQKLITEAFFTRFFQNQKVNKIVFIVIGKLTLPYFFLSTGYIRIDQKEKMKDGDSPLSLSC